MGSEPISEKHWAEKQKDSGPADILCHVCEDTRLPVCDNQARQQMLDCVGSKLGLMCVVWSWHTIVNPHCGSAEAPQDHEGSAYLPYFQLSCPNQSTGAPLEVFYRDCILTHPSFLLAKCYLMEPFYIILISSSLETFNHLSRLFLLYCGDTNMC